MAEKFPSRLIVDPSNGVVRGDDKAMPNRGTDSGMVGFGAPYGASIDANATNRMGSAHMEGDSMERVMPKGDADLRFSSGGHSSPDPGTGMGSAANSDPAAETEPNESAARERSEGSEDRY